MFSAQAFRHCGRAEDPLLSLKSMANGRAIYKVGRACFAVDEGGYLILNDGQAYEIDINSPTRVESFIVYFPRDWAADVLRALATPADQLLGAPIEPGKQPVHFFERVTAHDEIVSPRLRRLRAIHKRGTECALEEELRELLASMLRAQRGMASEIEKMPALRLATREELWRRLNRARDFIRARFEAPLSLEEVATVACLSPFHFLRAYKSAFGTSPHGFMTACRVKRAKFLLERTDMAVKEICLSVGFESLGTFSSWFRRYTGVSTREWRMTNKQ